MDYESARAIFGEMDDRLADIGASVRDLVEVTKAADRGRNDALSVVGSIKAASHMQDVEIQAIKDRQDAHEEAIQSCLSTLGEVNKVVAAIAARIPQ